MDSILDSKMSFELAALIVTLIAAVLLMLAVGNLHMRLQRLERAAPASTVSKPYANLLGKQVQGLIDEITPGGKPQVCVFLSSVCKSCTTLLNDLKSQAWAVPTAIVWTDSPPESTSFLPNNTVVLSDGPKISAELGIRVTPFVIVTGEDGRVINSGPINNVKSLGHLIAETPMT